MHKLIVPTLCVGMQPEPLCGSGRWSVATGLPRRMLVVIHKYYGWTWAFYLVQAANRFRRLV